MDLKVAIAGINWNGKRWVIHNNRVLPFGKLGNRKVLLIPLPLPRHYYLRANSSFDFPFPVFLK